MKLQFVFLGCFLLTGCETLTLNKVETPVQKNLIENKNVEIEKKSENKAAKPSKIDDIDTVQEIKVKVIRKPKPSPQEQANIWDRIAMQMKMPIPKEKRIRQFRNWYLKNPHHLDTVAARARPFLHLITEKVEARNIPIELALLPIVESSFDQFAYSHGKAAGLWQFVPDTARRFGLEQNWWYDGRRDIVKSTDAALDLLVYLQKKFDGDWLHALAAYNTGEGRVFKAIRTNKEAGKPTDFWSLDLPKETSGYVPKLLAVADVIKNQEKYNFELPIINNKPQVEIVKPGVQIELSLAAEYAGIPLDRLQNLNPAYNHWSTAPEGPHHLLLPKNASETFTNNLKAKGNKGFKLTRYKVKPGDSLIEIASNYNTTVSMLKRANNLNKPIIRIGQHLMIPMSKHQKRSNLQSTFERMQKRVNKVQGNYKISHTVKEGESFWIVANNHDVSIKNIARWNNLDSKKPLRTGQKLILWKKAEAGTRMRTIVYKIKNGDSLSTIAHRYKVKLSDLIKWNSLRKDTYIQPGQQLTLHIDVNKVSA